MSQSQSVQAQYPEATVPGDRPTTPNVLDVEAVGSRDGSLEFERPRRWGLFGGLVAGILAEPLSSVDERPMRGRHRPRSSHREPRGSRSSSPTAVIEAGWVGEDAFIYGPSIGVFDIGNEDGEIRSMGLAPLDLKDELLESLRSPGRSKTRLHIVDAPDVKWNCDRVRNGSKYRTRLRKRRHKEGEGVNDYLLRLYRSREVGINADFQWRLRERFDLWRMQNMLEKPRSEIFTLELLWDIYPQKTRVSDWSQSTGLHFQTMSVNIELREGGKKVPVTPEFGQSAVFITTLPDRHGYLTVSCEFPANDYEDDPFPARELFEELILDTARSSLAFVSGSPQMTRMLITLDLLRASVDAWHTALQHLAKWSKLTTASFTHLTAKTSQEDTATIDGLASSIHDMGACLNYLLEMIESSSDITNIKRWAKLKIEISARLGSLKDTIDNIRRDNERRLKLIESDWNQRQAFSAKRLTLVASIFLPLTLAASLLSMGSRARDLGELWYDWVGICITVGAATLVPYRVYRGIQRTWYDHRYAFTSFLNFLKGARTGFSYTALWLHYFPMLVRLELLAILASFLTGMFFDVGVGLRILGGSAATVAVILFLTLLLYFARLLGKIWDEYRRGNVTKDDLKGLLTVAKLVVTGQLKKRTEARRKKNLRTQSEAGSPDRGHW